MIYNMYFHPLKKTGLPVETGRPLRLLDMRIFNCICCAEITAYDQKEIKQVPSLKIAFFFNNSFVKQNYAVLAI
jgi:hypothetical protein